jgi:hypothetical protein
LVALRAKLEVQGVEVREHLVDRGALAAPFERHELWFEDIAFHDTKVLALFATEANLSDTIVA